MIRALSTALSALAFAVFACLPASAQSCCDHSACDYDSTTAGMLDPSTQSSKVIAAQSPYRISRRKLLDVPSNQQDESSEKSKPLFDGSRVDVSKQFDKWKDDYVRPVVCPVLMCHGSCAKTDLGCKGIYGAILGAENSCCVSAPPVVQEAKGVFPLRSLDD